MKRVLKTIALSLCVMTVSTLSAGAQGYTPSEKNLQNRADFEKERFGILLCWGFYSMFGNGEWVLETQKLNHEEYAKAAGGFYPSRYNASEWVKAFKDAGAKYVCITTRHHDGFSMFDTKASDYDIMDATPFKRDIIGELSKACDEEGVALHLYYSLLDWGREDYPICNTGKSTGRKGDSQNYDSYFNFMKEQVKELLTQYNTRALWFDGYWDQQKSFDWRMNEFYKYIHGIKPECLIGNNHHLAPIAGEDFQMFERDMPGENTAGFSAEATIGTLPLEMCQTMPEGDWGYNARDFSYRSVEELIRMLVRAVSKNSNLLLNIGPRPDGTLPDLAIDRLKGMGEWMRKYGDTVYGNGAGSLPEQPWGVTTRCGDTEYLHLFTYDSTTLEIPFTDKVKKVCLFDGHQPLKYKWNKKAGTLTVELGQVPSGIDTIVEIIRK